MQIYKYFIDNLLSVDIIVGFGTKSTKHRTFMARVTLEESPTIQHIRDDLILQVPRSSFSFTDVFLVEFDALSSTWILWKVIYPVFDCQLGW